MDSKMFNSLLGHYKLKAFYFPREIKTVPQEIIFPLLHFPPATVRLARREGRNL